MSMIRQKIGANNSATLYRLIEKQRKLNIYMQTLQLRLALQLPTIVSCNKLNILRPSTALNSFIVDYRNLVLAKLVIFIILLVGIELSLRNI